MTQPRHITYSDELLADGTAHRRYEDGRSEWRRRGADGLVHWHDTFGDAGTDERLGTDLVKRVHADGRVDYGRDIGYGRTVWGNGDTVLVNRTSFGGRLGVVLTALGLAGAVAVTQYPPLALSPEEEEELRAQARAQAANGSAGDGGSGSGDSGGGDYSGGWDDTDDGGWDGDDFG
ncbi:hypothetical protein ACFRKE_10225 [Kitasatospora indigofera]|uniref:hypothetical protein n=1 Tax=Kitasatospora indigofera TaxID=67307 RepID=UPI0036B87B58